MKKNLVIYYSTKKIECITICDGFWSYFLYIWQVDWQVLLVVDFIMLSLFKW
jgi:hypothetical protein